jgi:hypothetical protein
VTSARENYVIRIPDVSCGETPIRGLRPREVTAHGYSGTSLNRDVARGATVTQSLSSFALFSGLCGRPPFTTHWTRHSATIEVLYQHTAGEGETLVGSTTISEPPGTRPAP